MTGFAALAAFGREALRNGEPTAIAHLVRVAGSHYRRPGARMVLTASGRNLGSISGGCLEADLIRRIPQVVAARRPVLLEFDTSNGRDAVWGFGLGCNGRVAILLSPLDEAVLTDLERIGRLNASGETATCTTVLPKREAEATTFGDTRAATETLEVVVEEIEPAPSLLICGTGPDALPLARLASSLTWQVTVLAPRPTPAAAERFRDFGALAGLEEVERLAGRGRCAAIVMTHNYLDDLDLLRRLLPLSPEYLGILGPRDRTRRLERDLEAEGLTLTAEEGSRVHSPAGLDIGAETPEEIALAIAAEIQAVRSRRGGGFLSLRRGPIHETPPGAIILAAGGSSRMRCPKQLLVLDGETLIGRAARGAAEAGCHPVVVVLGGHAGTVRPHVEALPVVIAENPRWRDGLSGSIRAGLDRLLAQTPEVGGCFLLLADQPHADADLLRRMRRLAGESGAPIVACRYGEASGAPALFDRSLFGRLRELDGDRGAALLIAEHEPAAAFLDFPLGPLDVDTPADCARLGIAFPADREGVCDSA